MKCERVALCAYEGPSFVEAKRTSPVYTGCTSKEVALWFIACYWHLCPAGFFSGPIREEGTTCPMRCVYLSLSRLHSQGLGYGPRMHIV